MDLKPIISVCQAIVQLMDPLVETVIHDIQTERISFIAGQLSKRQVGDPSLLGESIEEIEQQIDEVVYPKMSFDGRLIKSISVPLKHKGKTLALLCINCDLSIFSQLQSMSALFLNVASREQPQALFRNDWQERLHLAISERLQEQGLVFDHLTLSQKKELVRHLYQAGAFHEKNAADYIARILTMGRATIFNYLKEWRSHDNSTL